jgi:hypothetical protein
VELELKNVAIENNGKCTSDENGDKRNLTQLYWQISLIKAMTP